MPNREELLAEKTHKNDGVDLDVRVFSTLEGDSKLTRETAHATRKSKAIALLFRTLFEAGMLSEEQIDEILLRVAL